MDIAAQLRFDGNADRLEILDDLIPAQQLQSIRRLTPATVSLLEAKWNANEIPSAPELGRQISKAGAGYGDPETNRKGKVIIYLTHLLDGRPRMLRLFSLAGRDKLPNLR